MEYVIDSEYTVEWYGNAGSGYTHTTTHKPEPTHTNAYMHR